MKKILSFAITCAIIASSTLITYAKPQDNAKDNTKSEKLYKSMIQKNDTFKSLNVSEEQFSDKMKKDKENYKNNKDAKFINDFGDTGFLVTVDSKDSKEDVLAKMLDVNIQGSGNKSFSDYDRTDYNGSYMYCDMAVSFYYENNWGPDLCKATAANKGAWLGSSPFYANTITPTDRAVHWFSTQSTGVTAGGSSSGPSGSVSTTIGMNSATVSANWSSIPNAWNYDAQFKNNAQASDLYNYEHYSGASYVFPGNVYRNTSTSGYSYY